MTRAAAVRGLGAGAALCIVAALLVACTGSSSPKRSSSAPVSNPVSTGAGVSTSISASSPSSLPGSTAKSSPLNTAVPSSGGINVTVPARRVSTAPPIPLKSTATVVPSVTAHIVRAESVRTQARGPGEISGPGVKLTIQLTNGTGKAIGLNQTVVNVSDQNNNPASPITTGSAPFNGTLAAHRSATGVYVFTLPSSHTTKVNVELSYSADAPTIVFSGPFS